MLGEVLMRKQPMKSLLQSMVQTLPTAKEWLGKKPWRTIGKQSMQAAGILCRILSWNSYSSYRLLKTKIALPVMD